MIAGDLERLIQLLARLPGLGPRSARRAVLHLMKKREALMLPLAEAMARAAETVTVCSTCGNLDTRDPCGICADPTRDPKLLCVVEEVADLWPLERSGAFTGRSEERRVGTECDSKCRSCWSPYPENTEEECN